MALVKTKSKIVDGWSYRGFHVIKTETGNWNVNLVSSDIEVNDNIQQFLDDTHKQLKKSCEIIDELYEGNPYTKTKSIKERENSDKIETSWKKFYQDSRSKKCEEIFKKIYSELKGLHYGEQKRSVDELGNIRYYWLPINTDYATHLGYPTWNTDVLEEMKARFTDEAIIHINTHLSFTIEIILEEKALSDFFLNAA